MNGKGIASLLRYTSVGVGRVLFVLYDDPDDNVCCEQINVYISTWYVDLAYKLYKEILELLGEVKKVRIKRLRDKVVEIDENGDVKMRKVRGVDTWFLRVYTENDEFVRFARMIEKIADRKLYIQVPRLEGYTSIYTVIYILIKLI